MAKSHREAARPDASGRQTADPAGTHHPQDMDLRGRQGPPDRGTSHRSTHALVIHPDPPAGHSNRKTRGLGPQPHRLICGRTSPGSQTGGPPPGRSFGTPETGRPGSHRTPTHSAPVASFSDRLRTGCLPTPCRATFAQSFIRAAVGTTLDGCLAVQRLVWTSGKQRDPLQPAAHLALARLDHRIAERQLRLRPDAPRDAGRRRDRSRRRPDIAGDGVPRPQLVQVRPQHLAL